MDFKQPDENDNPLTPEESRLYDEAISRLRREIAQGHHFAQALLALDDLDEEFRQLVAVEFLKILLAEEHFGKGRGLEELAGQLGLAPAYLEDIRGAMLEEVGQELAAQYRQQLGKWTH